MKTEQLSAKETLEKINELHARITAGEVIPHEERSPHIIGQDAAVALGRLARGMSHVKFVLTEV